MKVIVLGAGVVGTASAWYLADAGHEVVVVERREGPGLETSFANGGHGSVGHAEPWAGPGSPAKILRWLSQDDAPLLFRPRMDPAQWRWGVQFLLECLAWRASANTAQIFSLALYSRQQLQLLRARTGIAYDESTRGILHLYTDKAAFASARESSALFRRLGLAREEKSVEEALALEPAIAPCRDRLAGAIFVPSDETGDAHRFTAELAKRAEAKGVAFLAGREIQGLRATDKGVTAVVVKGPAGEEAIAGDAFVVALGSYSPLLTRPLGIDLPVYPAKGYSATVAVADPARAPRVALTDDEAKLVITRLGDRLRVAGTAELSGYSTDLNPVRCEALVRRMREMLPEAGDWANPAYWTGLRPATPSGVPIIGRTRIPNLWINTGHGTLGWTMACGSGRALADRISGRRPEVAFAFAD